MSTSVENIFHISTSFNEAKQANDSELIQYATEIRVRAQRRAGEMLAMTPKRTGGDAAKARSNASIERIPPTLEDMGITLNQSANWQSLASMSDEHFEATIRPVAGNQ